MQNHQMLIERISDLRNISIPSNFVMDHALAEVCVYLDADPGTPEYDRYLELSAQLDAWSDINRGKGKAYYLDDALRELKEE